MWCLEDADQCINYAEFILIEVKKIHTNFTNLYARSIDNFKILKNRITGNDQKKRPTLQRSA